MKTVSLTLHKHPHNPKSFRIEQFDGQGYWQESHNQLAAELLALMGDSQHATIDLIVVNEWDD